MWARWINSDPAEVVSRPTASAGFLSLVVVVTVVVMMAVVMMVMAMMMMAVPAPMPMMAMMVMTVMVMAVVMMTVMVMPMPRAACGDAGDQDGGCSERGEDCFTKRHGRVAPWVLVAGDLLRSSNPMIVVGG